MALTQTTSISIKQIDNYKFSKNKFIDSKNCLLINCPYDAELIEEIKGLNWQQREWDGKNWAILKDEEDQQSGQETNLEFVRRITKECAERRGWLLADYTAGTKAEAEKEVEAKEAELLENHIAAVESALSNLPPYSLRLIRWGKTLKLQLTQYLGDTHYRLFKELYDACTKVWKPQVLASFDPKMQTGFVFEVANDERVIRALMRCKGVEYLKVRDLEALQIFDDGVSHLRNEQGDRFIGLSLAKVDMSELNFESQTWQVASVNDDICWVDSFFTYIASWLEEKDYSVFYRVCVPKQSSITSIITFFHLEKWFKEWAQSTLATDKLQQSYFGDLKAKTHKSFWQHPADKLISHINRFGSRGGEQIITLIGFTSKEWQERIFEIEELRSAYAVLHLQELKSKARELVINRLISCKDKKGLLQLAARESVAVKKSWVKEAIASEIVDQEYAEKELEINC